MPEKSILKSILFVIIGNLSTNWLKNIKNWFKARSEKFIPELTSCRVCTSCSRGEKPAVFMTSLDTCKLIGFRKKDVDRNWSQIVVRVNNLRKRRDIVRVTFPRDRNEPLIVEVNEEVYCRKLLPGSVLYQFCKYKVKYGDKGEIKLKLRKSEPEDWMHRWSPSRETQPTPSLASSSINNCSNSINSDILSSVGEQMNQMEVGGFKIEEL